MGLYKLKNTTANIEEGFVEKINTNTIDYERYFESWLENSPGLLFDDENTVLWIGRQVTANVGTVDKFPDLIGIDSNGDLIIVELKKGKTPRDIIAQILEYASWGALLDYESLDNLARKYYVNDKNHSGKSLKEVYKDVFNIVDASDSEIYFNRKQKLYIVAEKISPIVKQVSEYLRDSYKININHLEYEVLHTKDGDYLLSVEKALGFDFIQSSGDIPDVNLSRGGGNGAEKNKDIVYKGVMDFTKGNKDVTFMPKDIIKTLQVNYESINKSSVRCRLIQDCVNHNSRKHYRGGQQDLYYYENGSYRLYDSSTDGKWDLEGNEIK